jgi:monoamine oxidase
MARPDYDALVVGAGAAGLAATAALVRAGLSVLVLEARDRIGGRAWTHHERGLRVPIELGAEFIHGRPAETLSLLRKTGTAADRAPRTRCNLRDGEIMDRGAAYTEIRNFVRAIRLSAANDVSFETLLERNRHRLSADALAFARMRVQSYDAADPARVSARDIIEEWRNESTAPDAHLRPHGGYGALLASLASGLDEKKVHVRLNAIVRTVRWSRGAVEVEGDCEGRPWNAAAARAIITLPLGVLQLPRHAKGAVNFSPALREKQPALKALVSGPVLKVALKFRSAFWEKLEHGRYRNVAFFHAPGAMFPTFWTALPARAPLLIAWAAGPNAMRLAGAGKRDIVRHAVKTLTGVFGRRAGVSAKFEGALLHDWQRDPFARGAYSHVLVGGGTARAALAAPLRETLYFAGEATDVEGEAGTVAGALQSGTRAARELVAQFA